jgi:hypothetical protein
VQTCFDDDTRHDAFVSTPAQPPVKRGCFFYGCISSIVLVLLMGLGGYLGVRYFIKTTDRLISEYTDTMPMMLEKVEVSADHLKEVQQRVATFKEALDKQSSAQELALSAEDINTLIAGDPAFREWRDKLFVHIEGDRIQGQLSLPLEEIGWKKLKGRYLNGTATFKCSLEKGALKVVLDDVAVKGKPLPATLRAVLLNRNLVEDARNNPKNANAVQQFDTIKVEGGKLIFKNKVKE